MKYLKKHIWLCYGHSAAADDDNTTNILSQAIDLIKMAEASMVENDKGVQ